MLGEFLRVVALIGAATSVYSFFTNMIMIAMISLVITSIVSAIIPRES